MPGRVAQAARQARFQVQLLAAQSHTQTSWSGFCKRWQRFRLWSLPLPTLIEKPFTVDGMLTKVRDLLGAGVRDA